jgi:predicted MFS family arabinose efflux permease
MVNVVLPRERAKLKRFFPKRAHFLFERKTHEFPKRSISIGLFLIIIFCQIAFSVVGISAFRDYYLKINREKILTLNTLLKEEIEGFLKKRLPLDRLFRMEVVMGEMLTQFPEASNIVILNAHEDPLYEANQSGVFNYTKKPPSSGSDALSARTIHGAAYRVQTDLRKDGKIVGYILSNLSKKQIISKLRDIVLDTFTVLMISALFSFELLLIIYRFLEKETAGAEEIIAVHYGTIRPAAFLFLFGVDVSISFLPLHMERLYEPLLGLSKDLVMGLPISVEMFFVGLSLMLAGIWIDRRGWHEPFFVGLFLAGIGILHSWLAPDAWHFIASRGVVGMGFGLSLMAAQGFIFSHTDESRKARGIATFFAGVYSGSICGGAAGAMLAERIGYRPVFLVGAVIVFLVIGYTFYFMRGAVQRPEKSIMETPVRSTEISQFLRFFFNRNILSLLLFNALPAAVVVVGFLNYFSPIYLNRMGASQSNIGRIFMIYGICLIFMGPFVSRYIDASNNKKAFVTIGGVLGGLGFITFYFFEGIFATAVTVLILGISGSFASSRIAYVLKLKITQELGGGKAMGIFNASSRIGQVLGPMVFCWIVIGWGAQSSIAFVGIIYLLASVLFFFFAQSDKRNI